MKLDLKVIKTLLVNKTVYPTVIILALDLIFLGILIFFGYKAYSSYNEMLSAEDEVQRMKATVTLIRNNRNLISGNAERYNTILENLIPEEESYFSVITALEKLTAKTGVKINSYSVNLTSSTEEKLTLKVDIVGDEASIQKFIQEYKFASGRLITTEEMDLSTDKLESLSLSINLFHNAFKDTVTSDAQIKPDDLKRLDEIAVQM